MVRKFMKGETADTTKLADGTIIKREAPDEWFEDCPVCGDTEIVSSRWRTHLLEHSIPIKILLTREEMNEALNPLSGSFFKVKNGMHLQLYSDSVRGVFLMQQTSSDSSGYHKDWFLLTTKARLDEVSAMQPLDKAYKKANRRIRRRVRGGKATSRAEWSVMGFSFPCVGAWLGAKGFTLEDALEATLAHLDQGEDAEMYSLAEWKSCIGRYLSATMSMGRAMARDEYKGKLAMAAIPKKHARVLLSFKQSEFVDGRTARSFKVQGYPLSQVAAWLGSQMFCMDDAEEALASLGASEVNQGSLRVYLSRGRNGRTTGKPPESMKRKLMAFKKKDYTRA